MKKTQASNKMKNVGLFFATFLFMSALILTSTQSKAQPTKPWVAPPAALAVKNPFAGDANAAKEGKKLYVTYCTPCHGNTGKGDGIAAASVNPKPADHTSDKVQSEPDGSLYWKMTEGRGPMISYKQLLKDDQRWQLVCYIKTLGKKK